MKRILLMSFVLLGLITSAWAQRAVTGKVTDAKGGEGLPGVAVRVKNTSGGTVTDMDGNYRLDVPSDNATLSFSFVGYNTKEVAVGNQSVVNVQLAEDVEQLEAVVVTAVGIETTKRQLGYSVQEVDSKQITNANEGNIVSALNSKVAGVNIYSSSGDPGASASIRIRGNTSITGSNAPLFVVDGVPINNSEFGNNTGGVGTSNRAIDINPNDIENMTVLKGPAATVLYGIRAANGAVIITTKRGRKETTPTVTVSSSVEVTEVNKLPGIQTRYAQGRNGIYRGPETNELWSWGPAINTLEYDGDAEYLYHPLGKLVPAGSGNGIPGMSYNAAEDFFVRGFNTDNNVAVRGGTERSTYYFSLGRLDQSGIVPNSNFARTSLKATISSDITEKLTATVSATYANSGGRRMERGSNLRGVMLGLMRNSPTFDIGNGLTGQDAADNPDSYQFANGNQRSYRNGIYDNPYWVVNKNYTTDEVNRVMGFASLSYEILPSLTATYKLGLDQFSDRRLGHIDISRGFVQPGVTVTWFDGEVNNDNIFNRDLNSDFLLSFSKELEAFSINATVGHNYYSSNYRRHSTDGLSLSAPGFYNVSNASNVTSEEIIQRRKLAGVFGDLKFGFRDILFLNLSGRNDWSSTLPAEDNSFFYPAASLGFVVTELLGMNNNAILPYAKLRASYGKVGNDAPLYATTNYFTQASVTGDGFTDGLQFPILGYNAFEQDGTLANSNLRPELTTTFEVGADLRFLKNRVALDLTYYSSETEDQILPVDISSASGFTSSIQNAGLVTNKGIEAVLTGSPIETDNFTWDVNVNFTRYRTRVEELLPELGVDNIFLAGFTSASSRAIAGQPFGVLQSESGFARDPEGNIIIDGDGFPAITSTPTIIGDPNPDWLMGIRNTFTYKGVSVSGLLDIRQGGDVWNGTYGILQYFGTSENSAEERDRKGVIFEGVTEVEDGVFVPNTQQVDLNNPAIGTARNRWTRYGFGTIGEENVQDGSWLRVREVALSYELPKALIERAGIGAASLTLTGRNLFLWTPYTGIDPETNLTGTSNGFGLEYFNNPNTRGYGAALRITF